MPSSSKSSYVASPALVTKLIEVPGTSCVVCRSGDLVVEHGGRERGAVVEERGLHAALLQTTLLGVEGLQHEHRIRQFAAEAAALEALRHARVEIQFVRERVVQRENRRAGAPPGVVTGDADHVGLRCGPLKPVVLKRCVAPVFFSSVWRKPTVAVSASVSS